MTAFLGMEPDETTVRGSRIAQPALPVCHCWKIVCRQPVLRVDEQITQVIERLDPHIARVTELVQQLTGEPEAGHAAVLQVVRYFSPVEGPDNLAAEAPNLFGWDLDRKALAFLTATGAVLDVDEYDLSTDAEAGGQSRP